MAVKPADTKETVKGQRRCILVIPKTAAPGKPWSWRGCYWDHEPQTEIELLKRGFHIAYITADANLRPDLKWDAWYAFLTEKQSLSKRPAFIGMSRGGEYAFTWATANPDKVACIYADNPGGNKDIFRRLPDLAGNDVPLLLVCGSIDPLLGRVALPIESAYRQFGGRASIMIKEGAGHHPHSLRDPKPIADFITQSVREAPGAPPAFVGSGANKTAFYSVENAYRDFPSERTYVTCRGPVFAPCYDRYDFGLPGVEGSVNVIAPRTPAPGKPWVFRAGFAERDAVVDLALLAKGFHIVTGPVSYNANGPLVPHWDAVYKHLTNNGFSSKPVMEGAGGAAGEVYAWAIANPEKVSCIYTENAVMRSAMAKTPLLDHLDGLAKAGVPLIHVCGKLDPSLNDNSAVVEERYQKLGGRFMRIVQEGIGHYPLAPADSQPVIDFIANAGAPAEPAAEVPKNVWKGQLLAGDAKISITPENCKKPVHDPANARALVLEVDGKRLAFVSVDLGVYTSEHLVAACKEKFHLSQMVLSSSHTHSDPGGDYKDVYEAQILQAVDAAVKNLFPARICAGHRSFPQLGFNRLVIREDGHARESWDGDDHYLSENPDRIPFGPVDPEVGVIKIEDTNGQPRVLIMNYACHADVVCGNYAVSADFPGVACRKVEEAFGTNLTCLFVQGAAGNIESLIISSRRSGPDDPFQTDYNTIEHVGHLLSYEAIKLAKSIAPKPGSETTIRFMNDSLRFAGRFNKDKNFDVHICTLLINDDIAIATVPGEPFIQLQLDWKQKVGMPQPFVFGYTWYGGTWPNYIPDIVSAARGGYGADQNGPVMIEVGSGEAIMNKHLENVYRLSGLMRETPGPTEWKGGDRWIYTAVPRAKE